MQEEGLQHQGHPDDMAGIHWRHFALMSQRRDTGYCIAAGGGGGEGGGRQGTQSGR